MNKKLLDINTHLKVVTAWGLVLITCLTPAGALAATEITFNPALGTYPPSQGWMAAGSPNSSLSGAILTMQGTGSQYYTEIDPTLDFSTPSPYSFQIILRDDGLNYLTAQGAGSTRSGFTACLRDVRGTSYNVSWADVGVTVNQFSRPLISMSLNDGAFHRYIFTVVNNVGSLSMDGNVIANQVAPEVSSGACGAPGQVLWGPAASVAHGTAEISLVTAGPSAPNSPAPPPLGGFVTVTQNYTNSVMLSCPVNYRVVVASCDQGAEVVLNDQTTPLPPFASKWGSYLLPNANSATAVQCNLTGQAQAQLRCTQ